MYSIESIIAEVLFRTFKIIKTVERYIFQCFPSVLKVFVPYVFRQANVIVHTKEGSDVQVLDDRFFVEVVVCTTLGMGESYMKGWIELKDIEECAYRGWRNKMGKWIVAIHNRILNQLMFNTVNLQVKSRARVSVKRHYDVGNDLFEAFLDPTMNYSCAYWRNADNLNEAQLHKMDLVARKLKLQPGMRVLDIGCGWGSLCKYLAENYDVEVVGYTISVEQIKYARQLCKGLKVRIVDADYREITGKFDRIVSVAMFEHVGPKNYRTYFEVANRCLVDDGIFLLHTIGVNHDDIFLIDPFLHTYIFPNFVFPYFQHITSATEGLFIIEDWHNFGHDYARTLRAWHKNFEDNWPNIADKYGKVFRRMWKFYLLGAAGLFRARRLNLWQIVFSKDGLEGGYLSER